MKIAMIQMMVKTGEMEANLRRATALIKRAAERGCDAVVLPECCDIGWANPEIGSYASPVPGVASEIFSRVAKESEVLVVAGISEKSGDRFYNTALIIEKDGQIMGIHRKINLLEGVEDMFSRGDRLLVYDCSIGRIGVNICADNFAHMRHIGSSLGEMGAQVILSPCSWAVSPEDYANKRHYGQDWTDSYRWLSYKYDLSVVGVSNVGDVGAGAWKGWKCIGNSIAVSGERVYAMPYGVDAEEIGIYGIN